MSDKQSGSEHKSTLHIGEYQLWHWRGHDFHVETLQSLLMVNFLLLVFFIALNLKLHRRNSLLPGSRIQSAAEWVVQFINGIINN